MPSLLYRVHVPIHHHFLRHSEDQTCISSSLTLILAWLTSIVKVILFTITVLIVLIHLPTMHQYCGNFFPGFFASWCTNIQLIGWILPSLFPSWPMTYSLIYCSHTHYPLCCSLNSIAFHLLQQFEKGKEFFCKHHHSYFMVTMVLSFSFLPFGFRFRCRYRYECIPHNFTPSFPS